MITAAEYLKNHPVSGYDEGDYYSGEVEEFMIEFARLAIAADRTNVVQYVEIMKECGKRDNNNCDAIFCHNCVDCINRESILNAPNIELL